MSTTETQLPEGIVVERFLRRCTSRYMGRSRRWGVREQFGLFFRAAIVVRLDDGRRVRGYITNAYETTTEAKARANERVQVGDRVRVTCPIEQYHYWKRGATERTPSRTWFPTSDARGFLQFERLTVPSTSTP